MVVAKTCWRACSIQTRGIDNFPIEIPFEEPQLVADLLIRNEPGASAITLGWAYPGGKGCFVDDELGRWSYPCSADNSKGPDKVKGTLAITEKETAKRYQYVIQTADKPCNNSINVEQKKRSHPDWNNFSFSYYDLDT